MFFFWLALFAHSFHFERVLWLVLCGLCAHVLRKHTWFTSELKHVGRFSDFVKSSLKRQVCKNWQIGPLAVRIPVRNCTLNQTILVPKSHDPSDLRQGSRALPRLWSDPIFWACAEYLFHILSHSRSQSPRSFWPAAGIESSGFLQHRKFPIHRLKSRQIWQIWLAENMKRILCTRSENRVRPELSIPAAGQKDRGSGDENDSRPIRFARFDRKSHSCPQSHDGEVRESRTSMQSLNIILIFVREKKWRHLHQLYIKLLKFTRLLPSALPLSYVAITFQWSMSFNLALHRFA